MNAHAPERRRPGWRGLAVLVALLLSFGLLATTTPLLSWLVMQHLNRLPIVLNPVASQSQVSGGLSAMGDEPGSPEWLADHARPALSGLGGEHSGLSDQMGSAMDRIDAGNAPELAAATPRNLPLPNVSVTIGAQTWRMAQAIVVLGGGLGRDYQGRIIPNSYTQLRLSQAILQHKATDLPILLSGVEAPWMQKWLLDKGEQAAWLESLSMNTCENARFSALLLQKQGGAAQVELVTDYYHMPRARRLFALNGIETVPVVAPLPGDPAPWWPDTRNMVHSRRAVHELFAVWRDLWFGEVNCRQVP